MPDNSDSYSIVERDFLEHLKGFDTPTICNALDLAAPDRPRDKGFTRQTMLALDASLAPMVGYARTAKISAVTAITAEAKRKIALKYYAYTAQAPDPRIVVVEDIDPEPGLGAHWGEVHCALHQGLGALGAITNGSMRDLDDCAEGFQVLAGSISPSHAYVHITDFDCEVNIFGMLVEHGDLIHADRHGAVVIPMDAVERLPEAIEIVMRREKIILDAIKDPDFNIESLRKALTRTADIH